MTLFEKLYGCLAGLAIGDALGMPTEFLTPGQIASEFGWVDRFVLAPTWHPHHSLAAGQITDDTGQTLAIARAFKADGMLDAGDVARSLLAWGEAEGDRLELIVGPATRQALEKLKAGEDPRKTGQAGKTNGATYRGIAVGLVDCLRPERLIEDVVEACLPTHGTQVAIAGAAAVASALAAAVSETASLESILKAAQEGAEEGRCHGAWAWGTPLEKRIGLAAKVAGEAADTAAGLTDLYNYVGVDLLVAESVAAAFGIVYLAKGDPMQAVIYGANVGGDTDTIAALAGAVCGAWKGIDAIDRSMLAQVEAVNGIDLAAEAARIEAIIEGGASSDGE